MNINISSDIKSAQKKLSRVQNKQIPFAASLAINETAENANNAVKAQARKKLDNPRPQTVNAFRVGKRAIKSRLRCDVFILDWADEFLRYQIEGGVRRSGGAGTGVPVNQRLNKYGNIPGRRKGLVKKANQFIATIKGITGVWERGHYTKSGKFSGGKKSAGTAVKLVVAFETSVKYKARLPYYKIVNSVVASKFNRNFSFALKRALATAR